MKICDMKIGMRVRDRWFDDWGIGKVVKFLSRNRVLIQFSSEGDVIFDGPHCQFLDKIGKGEKS